MKRNYIQCPNDGNGDVLWRMLQSGDNLDKQREIDFSVIFSTDRNALQFAEQLLRKGHKVSFGSYKGEGGYPWQIQVHSVMLPTHEKISRFEELLSRDADPMGGRIDGWGCFAMD